jgi:glutamate-1-semialdehyde 2,1-aminomutase
VSIDFSLHRRAQDCIAQAALTNSKRPESHVKGVYPTHLKRGQGAKVWDHQGKQYLDFICGLGTSLLGYAHDRVNQAIANQMPHGASLSLGTHVELEAAEKLKEMMPFVEAVKFLKTGSEACSAAIRIARAFTGRNVVLSEAYHGWHDAFVSLTPPATGVPPHPEMRPFSWDGIEGAAAVIIEPIITDMGQDRIAWLHRLREACTMAGTLLIFDEVITGFRFPGFSVSRYFNITPDLICLGKAIANGMPLAAVGGKYAVMNTQPEYFVSSSYAGETLSLAAGIETMRLLQTKYSVDHLWERGREFLTGFNALWPEKIWIEGYPSRGAFKGDDMTKALFFQEACLAGLLFGPSFFLSFPMLDELPGVLQVCRDILTRIRLGQVTLKGEMPQSPFAQKVREAKP